MKNRDSSVRVALAAAGTAAIAATTMLVGAGTSAADPVTLTLKYQCGFPLIGAQPIEIQIDLDLPKTVAVGTEVPASAIKTVSKVNDQATAGLNLVGAKTLEGNALASVTLAAPEGTLPLEVPATLEKTPIPASGGFTVVATGETPAFTPSQPGTAKVTVGDVKLHLVPRKADGSLTGLGEFDSQCTQDPGQNNELTTIEITPAANAIRR